MTTTSPGAASTSCRFVSKSWTTRRGPLASSREFSRCDQIDKPDYRLSESADGPDDFDAVILQGHGIDLQLFELAGQWVEEFFSGTPLQDTQRFLARRHQAISR